MKLMLPVNFGKLPLIDQLRLYVGQLDLTEGSREMASVLTEAADEIQLLRQQATTAPLWTPASA